MALLCNILILFNLISVILNIVNVILWIKRIIASKKCTDNDDLCDDICDEKSFGENDTNQKTYDGFINNTDIKPG